MGRVRKFGAVLAAALCAVLPSGQGAATSPMVRAVPEAFTGCAIYRDADLPPISNGTLVINGTKIVAVGPGDEVTVPKGAKTTPCNGAVVLPAFWNSHVHFIEPRWGDAANTDEDELEGHLAEAFVRYGFATVIDTGSDLGNTRQLGRAHRPRILSTGLPFVPPNGTPFYVEATQFPELGNAEQARDAVNAALDQGANAIKLMTVSLTRNNPLPKMPLEVVRAVTETAHARGKLVFAHPTNRQGVELAIEGGVDVLLHTAPIGGPWDEALVQRMVKANMSLVPTLSLWDYEAAKTGDDEMAKHFREVSAQQLAAFAKAGGRILFGTDAGYMTQYDPTPEYLAMQAAGLSFQQILASLTTAPAEEFEQDRTKGTLTVGGPASFVVVDGDPAEDIRRLAQVRYTFIYGQEVYARQP